MTNEETGQYTNVRLSISYVKRASTSVQYTYNDVQTTYADHILSWVETKSVEIGD